MATPKTLPPLRDVIDRLNLRANKGLGQHFLLDLNITEKIVHAAGDLNEKHAIEIGPGPGGLTRPISQSNAVSFHVVEMDKRVIPALADIQSLAKMDMHIHNRDALHTDITRLCDAPRVVLSNLPYNIGTELLVNWLHQIDEIDQMVLMFQREVADRIIAKPNTKAYGRLSVLSQWLCEIDVVMHLPPQAFTPPPKVDSTVLRFRPKREKRSVAIETVGKLTKAAFGQRRKMLRGSLKTLISEPIQILEKAEIAPTDRAEDLTVEDFLRLAECFAQCHPPA